MFDIFEMLGQAFILRSFIAGFFIVIYQPFHVGDMVNLPEKNISGRFLKQI